MAIFHEKAGDEGTFAGGSMSQALAKHRMNHKESKGDDKKDKMREHLHAAHEHITAAKDMHDGIDEHESGDESALEAMGLMGEGGGEEYEG